MDLQSLFKFRQAWDTFTSNHPKFPSFLSAVKDRGLQEGTEITIAVTYPDGHTIRSGIRVKQSDLDLLNLIGSAEQ